MKKKIQNFIAYLRFITKYGRIPFGAIIIDTAILFIAIHNREEVMDMENKGFLVIFILFFITYIWQLWNLISHFKFLKSEAFTDEESIVSREEIPTRYSESVKSLYKNVDHEQLSFFIESDEYNQILRDSTPIAIQQQTEGKTKEMRVNAYLSNHFNDLFPFLNNKWRKGSFFNEEKLCMASEFLHTADGYMVELGKGSYYKSYLTNAIYNVKLVKPDQSDFIRPFCSAQTDEVELLQDSTMGDHIGVSTILITSDDYVILLYQNKDAAFNKQSYIASGSGSVDWADYQESYRDLRECIIGAAERELREEMFHKVSAEKIPHFTTRVVSFYRDMRRGGKPEFCCETRVNEELTQLKYISPNKVEQTECYLAIKLQKEADGYVIHPESRKKWQPIYDSASPTLLMCLYSIGVKHFCSGGARM